MICIRNVYDPTLEGDKIVTINKDNLFDNWMTMNVNFIRFDNSWSDDFINEWKHWNDGSIPGKSIGFVFNSESVKSEYAKIQAVESEQFLPITQGFVDYAKGFTTAEAKLKDAGIDKYMAELQKQFSDFYVKNAN